ncbi:MAG TPA: hypothetical protein VF717_04425 [Pyrinomonadaceae bacterium]|jgi:hypothetical protein
MKDISGRERSLKTVRRSQQNKKLVGNNRILPHAARLPASHKLYKQNGSGPADSKMTPAICTTSRQPLMMTGAFENSSAARAREEFGGEEAF